MFCLLGITSFLFILTTLLENSLKQCLFFLKFLKLFPLWQPPGIKLSSPCMKKLVGFPSVDFQL